MTSANATHPVVATHGASDSSAPLVVLLHGRGSNEQEILGLASHLPDGPEYAAVRAPIAEGGGYAWFANRGIGRPVAESLRNTMDWFRTWLDDVAPAGRPVILVGFSGGAAFAGGLVLDDPITLRRGRDPLRHPALRRRTPHRYRPTGQPARLRGPRRRRPRHPPRTPRPHLDLPAVRVRCSHGRPQTTRRTPTHRRDRPSTRRVDRTPAHAHRRHQVERPAMLALPLEAAIEPSDRS